jgi:hypothetical protein
VLRGSGFANFYVLCISLLEIFKSCPSVGRTVLVFGVAHISILRRVICVLIKHGEPD